MILPILTLISPYTDMSSEDVIKYFIIPANKPWLECICNSNCILKVQEHSERKAGDPWNFKGMYQYLHIILPPGDRNINLFTHELLHAYIYLNGFFSLERGKMLNAKGEKFRNAFSKHEEKLLNTIQHNRMFPMYRKAGFDPLQFRTDDDVDYKVNDKLKMLRAQNSYEDYFEKYIELFSIVVDESFLNKLQEYSDIKSELENLDKEIYDALTLSINTWMCKAKTDFKFDDVYLSLINQMDEIFSKK